MASTELVLSLGIEGGGADIYRIPLAAGGDQFRVEGSSICLNENEDEEWRRWTRGPVETIEDALRVIDGDGCWILFHPISVHPDYRMAVWQRVQELARALPAEHLGVWRNRVRDWERLCVERPWGDGS